MIPVTFEGILEKMEEINNENIVLFENRKKPGSSHYCRGKFLSRTVRAYRLTETETGSRESYASSLNFPSPPRGYIFCAEDREVSTSDHFGDFVNRTRIFVQTNDINQQPTIDFFHQLQQSGENYKIIEEFLEILTRLNLDLKPVANHHVYGNYHRILNEFVGEIVPLKSIEMYSLCFTRLDPDSIVTMSGDSRFKNANEEHVDQFANLIRDHFEIEINVDKRFDGKERERKHRR